MEDVVEFSQLCEKTCEKQSSGGILPDVSFQCERTCEKLASGGILPPLCKTQMGDEAVFGAAPSQPVGLDMNATST
eukprot:2886371-Prorocentrum_lima.AAC.1